MRKILDWPPVWLAIGLMMVWAIDATGMGPQWGLPAQRFGWLLVSSGICLMGLAAWEMIRAGTTVIPRRAPSRLVTTGVFSLSRNPIYLGDALVLAGGALVMGTALGLLVVPLFIWVITKRFIEGEEAMLARHFGVAYGDWCAAVRRWV